MKFFTLTNEDFAKILRDFRAYGTPHSNYLQSFGKNFFLATSPERDVYHLFFGCGEFHFVVEYIYKLELAQVEGDVDAFVRQMHEYFPTVQVNPL